MREEAGRKHKCQTKMGMMVLWKCVDSLLGQHTASENSDDELKLCLGVVSDRSVKSNGVHLK